MRKITVGTVVMWQGFRSSKLCDLFVGNLSLDRKYFSKILQVRKCLVSGLYNNIAEMQRDHSFVTVSSRQKTKIHPSSVLSGKTNVKCVLFTELVQTSLNFMRIVTIIEPEWIEEIVPNSGVTSRLSYCN